jgi:hypothetical protein
MLLMYLFIHFISLHVSSIKCSSSGDEIVLIHHLVCLVCVSDCLVRWSGGKKFPPDQHTKQSHILIIPDDVLIQFDLLMMSTVMLETCREMK